MMNSLLLNLIIAKESNLIVSDIQYVIRIFNFVVREHVNLVVAVVVVTSIVLSTPKRYNTNSCICLGFLLNDCI
uniref:Putative ovule protein n=1 Tax=Solanum chacoense TaxID=4108 RepID=A0A0V0GZH4_SOLCH